MKCRCRVGPIKTGCYSMQMFFVLFASFGVVGYKFGRLLDAVVLCTAFLELARVCLGDISLVV